MSHSLNASIIDQKYPVRSVHAQQWVNTITSLVFYTFLYLSYFSRKCKLLLKTLLRELINILYCTGGGGGWGRGGGIQHKLDPQKSLCDFQNYTHSPILILVLFSFTLIYGP